MISLLIYISPKEAPKEGYRRVNETYGESAGDRVKSNMHLVHKVGRLADAHQWGPRVYILHPRVHLFIRPKGEIPQLLFGLDFEAEWLEVDALNVFDLFQVTYLLW